MNSTAEDFRRRRKKHNVNRETKTEKNVNSLIISLSKTK